MGLPTSLSGHDNPPPSTDPLRQVPQPKRLSQALWDASDALLAEAVLRQSPHLLWRDGLKRA